MLGTAISGAPPILLCRCSRTCSGVLSPNTMNVGRQQRRVTSVDLCCNDIWTSHSASVGEVDRCQRACNELMSVGHYCSMCWWVLYVLPFHCDFDVDQIVSPLQERECQPKLYMWVYSSAIQWRGKRNLWVSFKCPRTPPAGHYVLITDLLNSDVGQTSLWCWLLIYYDYWY